MSDVKSFAGETSHNAFKTPQNGEMLGSVKIKICGLRRIEDVEAVNNAMPDYVGFVFAESKRKVCVETASSLKKNLDERIQTVGVFVNQPIDFIAGLYQDKIIDLIQLHGDEDAEFIQNLRAVCDGKIIKAVSIGKILPPLPVFSDYLLFDKASVQRGGTGEVFDWDILASFRDRPYFLAGGLSLENVAEAVRKLSPFAVDVSSGVETGGFKDPDKINRFVEVVREVV